MAVYSDVALCNMALSRIGIGQQITDLDAEADVERVCKLWFDKCRDVVLESFAWPMASRQVTLGLVEEEPNDDWSYSYRLPATCIVPRRIVSGSVLGIAEPDPVPFDMGQDNTGRLIFTNQEDAVLEMTAFLEDAGEFPNLFASAVAWLLASEIATPLSVDPAKEARARAGYREDLVKARGVANQGRRMPPPPPSIFISSRF